jgi:hypothetical protein
MFNLCLDSLERACAARSVRCHLRAEWNLAVGCAFSVHLSPEHILVEHRCGYRRPVSLSVIIRTRGGLAGPATLRDISASGAFVVTPLPLAEHVVVLVQFTFRDALRGRVRFSLPAEVVRHADMGVGLEWLSFSPKTLREIYSQLADQDRQSLSDGASEPASSYQRVFGV